MNTCKPISPVQTYPPTPRFPRCAPPPRKAVLTVNGKSPDENGNVDLRSDFSGIATKEKMTLNEVGAKVNEVIGKLKGAALAVMVSFCAFGYGPGTPIGVVHPDTPLVEIVDSGSTGVVSRVSAALTNYVDSATNAIRRADGAARPLPPYLHELSFDDTYPEDAAWYYSQPQDYGGCSAVRDGGFLYRNYDWRFDDAAEFVVRMSAGPGRFASIGVANCGTNLSESIVTGGKWSRYYRCLPGRMVDGINENGVVCEVNVVDGNPQTSGWKTGGDIHPLGAVRWVLDNATDAGMAAEALASRIAFPSGWSQNFHYMIADASGTYIVENGVASAIPPYTVAVMTNFKLYPNRDTGGVGQERYDALVAGASITSQWWTLTYTPSGYRPSDLQHVDSNVVFSAWANGSRESHRGEKLSDQSWWQTVHTSVYDIANRTLRVAVQETGDWYSFAVPSAGKVRSVNGMTGDVVIDVPELPSNWALSNVTNANGEAADGLLNAKRDLEDLNMYTNGFTRFVWTSNDPRCPDGFLDMANSHPNNQPAYEPPNPYSTRGYWYMPAIGEYEFSDDDRAGEDALRLKVGRLVEDYPTGYFEVELVRSTTNLIADTIALASITNSVNVSIGRGARVSQSKEDQIAIGSRSTANNNRAIAIGSGCVASNSNSIVIGYNAKSHGANTFNAAPDVGSWYAGDTPLIDALFNTGYVATNVEEVVTNDPPALASGRFAAGPGQVVTNRFRVYVPDPNAPKPALSGLETAKDLVAMLVDANTNETADRVCIRSNLVRIISQDLDAKRGLDDLAYVTTVPGGWTPTEVDGHRYDIRYDGYSGWYVEKLTYYPEWGEWYYEDSEWVEGSEDAETLVAHKIRSDETITFTRQQVEVRDSLVLSSRVGSQAETAARDYIQNNDIAKTKTLLRTGKPGEYGTGWGTMHYQFSSDRRWWSIIVPTLTASWSTGGYVGPGGNYVSASTVNFPGSSAYYRADPMSQRDHTPVARFVASSGTNGSARCSAATWSVGITSGPGTSSSSVRFDNSADIESMPFLVTADVDHSSGFGRAVREDRSAVPAIEFDLQDYYRDHYVISNFRYGEMTITDRAISVKCLYDVTVSNTYTRAVAHSTAWNTLNLGCSADSYITTNPDYGRVMTDTTRGLYYDPGLKATWRVAVTNGCFFAEVISTNNLTRGVN